ncbi:ATP-binding protein [Rhodovibrionaceae bacterium A322]
MSSKSSSLGRGADPGDPAEAIRQSQKNLGAADSKSAGGKLAEDYEAAAAGLTGSPKATEIEGSGSYAQENAAAFEGTAYDGSAEASAQSMISSRPWWKKILPRSLLGRSLLIILAPLVLVQVISTWVFYDRHYDHVTRRLSQSVAGEIAALVEIMNRPFPDWQDWLVYDLAARRLWLDIRLEDSAELAPTPEPFFPSILHDRLIEALKERLGDTPFSVDILRDDDYVQIQVDMGEQILDVLVHRRRLFTSTSYIFIMWMVGSSIILFIVALLFMRNQVRPIRRLAQAAESFGRGVDVSDFKPEGALEVRQASVAFLQMRERINRQIRQRTTMLAGVSHDLRTPLTRMKLELAMLHNAPEVESLKVDVDQMQRMIEGYLAFARGEGTEQHRETDIADLLRQVVMGAEREGARIDLHIEKAQVMPLRRETLRRSLANLINNARRAGTEISILAGPRKGGYEIFIDDNGPGIAADMREEVFKPFVRLEESRNLDSGGTGLGLTIARDAVHGHGGTLTLHDAPTGGLRARIWLPT